MKRQGQILVMALLMAALCMPAPVPAGGNIETVNASQSEILNAFWDPRTFPIRYKLNENLGLGLDVLTVKPEIDAAFAQWENLSDNTLDFAWGGTTPVTAVALDGTNALIFDPPTDPGGFVAAAPCNTLTTTVTVNDSSDGIPGNGLGHLLETGTPILRSIPIGDYGPGTNIDCDIIFEVFGTVFTTDLTSGTQDIRGISTHEIGHWLSLSHTLYNEASLYPFVDTNPQGDISGSSSTIHPDDVAAVGHFYKDVNYDANTGTITGIISLDGLGSGGVHVSALDADTLEPVAARFSMSRFLDPTDAVDGSDFLTFGPGFYRLDGLPPGDYYIYTEWLDGTDEDFGRLENRYNLTTGNSRVADGNSADWAGSLGFLPQRWEFHNTLESADGGDGSTAGAAGDNPDEATRFTLAAGDVVPGVDIQINLDPDGLKTNADRENPTGVSRHDLIDPTPGLAGGIGLPEDGTDDNYWVLRFPAADLPAPPYNVIEGIWTKNGRSDLPYTGALLMAEPGSPNTVQPAIVFDPPRLVAGRPGGGTGLTEIVDVRDRFNVTVNQSRDLFFAVKQPESFTSTIVDGYFIIGNVSSLTCSNNGVPCTIDPDTGDDDCSGPPSAVCTGGTGNTIFTDDNFATFRGFTGDVVDIVYRARTETTPAVLLTGASPSTLNQDDSGVVVTISGEGFRAGAEVDFLSPSFNGTVPGGITVLSTSFVSSTSLQATVDVAANARPGILDVQVRNPEVVIPNRARLMTVSAGPDGDGDGWTNSGDCASGDSNLWAVPGGIQNTVVATVPGGGGVQLDWAAPADPGGTAPTYNLVRGDGATLSSTAGGNYGSCQQTGIVGTTAIDSSLPAPGEVQIFMLNTENGCGSSPYAPPAGNPLRESNPGNC